MRWFWLLQSLAQWYLVGQIIMGSRVQIRLVHLLRSFISWGIFYFFFWKILSLWGISPVRSIYWQIPPHSLDTCKFSVNLKYLKFFCPINITGRKPWCTIRLPPCINYMQYPWGYALPVSHIISTCESYPQYPWEYALPISHIISTCESYPQYPWGYALPVSHILSTRESYPQYQWVISSVPVRIWSTRESYHQYLWVISSVPVRVCITRESYPQYHWGYAVPMSHIISTHESYPQYPWGYAVPMSKFIWMKN